MKTITNFRKQTKKDKGITILALVITIIVLLIITGISISGLSGENGIISKANQASMETQKGIYQEELEVIGIRLQRKSRKLEFRKINGTI